MNGMLLLPPFISQLLCRAKEKPTSAHYEAAQSCLSVVAFLTVGYIGYQALMKENRGFWSKSTSVR